MADAVFNVGRASLLVLGLAQGDLDLVARGLDDRLHQPRRASLYPRSMELVERARSLGALGATISGAGPSVLVWARAEAAADVAARLAADDRRVGAGAAAAVRGRWRRGELSAANVAAGSGKRRVGRAGAFARRVVLAWRRRPAGTRCVNALTRFRSPSPARARSCTHLPQAQRRMGEFALGTMNGHYFVSYSRIDGAEFALRLADELEAGPPSYRVWLDVREMQPGQQDWDRQLVEAIQTCAALLLVMTDDSVRDESGCKPEWVAALRYKKPVIPVRLVADVELPFRLSSRQFIEFSRQLRHRIGAAAKSPGVDKHSCRSPPGPAQSVCRRRVRTTTGGAGTAAADRGGARGAEAADRGAAAGRDHPACGARANRRADRGEYRARSGIRHGRKRPRRRRSSSILRR